jgi:hypothetical protein
MVLLNITAVLVDLASKRHTNAPPVYGPQGGGSGGSGLSSLAPGLLFFGALLLVGLIAYLAYAMQRRRREGFRQMAAQCGLEYSRNDPLGLLGYPFTLFSMGDGRAIENVVWGGWQETDVIAFDFMYYEQDGKYRTDYRFGCAIVPIGADSPRLMIEHENLMTSLAGALSFPDLQFESEAFNREFRVQCEVPKFANDVLDPRMMEWLLDNGSACTFEAVGDRMLVAGPRIEPAFLSDLLGVARGFAQHVPAVVSSLYPE